MGYRWYFVQGKNRNFTSGLPWQYRLGAMLVGAVWQNLNGTYGARAVTGTQLSISGHRTLAQAKAWVVAKMAGG